jgi:hypothetical protein
MHLVARTLRYFAMRFLADPQRSYQDTARTNAAQASAQLQRRRDELAEVESYLRAQHLGSRDPDGTQTSHG